MQSNKLDLTFFCGVAAEPTAETVARGDIVDFGPADPVIRLGDSCSQTTDFEKKENSKMQSPMKYGSSILKKYQPIDHLFTKQLNTVPRQLPTAHSNYCRQVCL